MRNLVLHYEQLIQRRDLTKWNKIILVNCNYLCSLCRKKIFSTQKILFQGTLSIYITGCPSTYPFIYLSISLLIFLSVSFIVYLSSNISTRKNTYILSYVRYFRISELHRKISTNLLRLDQVRTLNFRHRACCILGQAFHYSPENAFYIFN